MTWHFVGMDAADAIASFRCYRSLTADDGHGSLPGTGMEWNGNGTGCPYGNSAGDGWGDGCGDGYGNGGHQSNCLYGFDNGNGESPE